EHVRMSVSHFSPDDLTMVAGRVAQKAAAVGVAAAVGAGGGSSSVIGHSDQPPDAWSRFGDAMDRFGQRMNKVGDRIEERFGRRPGAAATGAAPMLEISDPLSKQSRHMLAFTTSLVVALAAGFVGVNSRGRSPLPISLF